jgi:hypothetical protein
MQPRRLDANVRGQEVHAGCMVTCASGLFTYMVLWDFLSWGLVTQPNQPHSLVQDRLFDRQTVP